jgi:Fis family transcriptional regulator, factor for inversion stimulation protein
MQLKQSSIAKLVNEYFTEFFTDFKDNMPEYDIYTTVINEVERSLINVALKSVKYNQTRTAKILGISRNTLRNKIKSLKIHDKH